MSISGTRSAYDDDEIADVAERIGRPPRSRQSTSAMSPTPDPGTAEHTD